MLSPTAQMAMEELERLKSQIAEAQSNLRILFAIGSPRKLEVQRKLNDAITKRDQLLAALRQEAEFNE